MVLFAPRPPARPTSHVGNSHIPELLAREGNSQRELVFECPLRHTLGQREQSLAAVLARSVDGSFAQRLPPSVCLARRSVALLGELTYRGDRKTVAIRRVEDYQVVCCL